MNKVKDKKLNLKKLEEDAIFVEIIGLFKKFIIASFLCILGIVIAFLFYLNQFVMVGVDTEYTQDGQGINNINTGTQGDVGNGAEINN